MAFQTKYEKQLLGTAAEGVYKVRDAKNAMDSEEILSNKNNG